MPDFVVQCVGVERCFGLRKAIDRLTLDILEGEVIALIGPNGSGKTTLIRLLLGFYQAHAGSIRVFGFDPVREFHKIGPHIGVMLEQPGLSDYLSAQEYLEFYGSLLGMSRREARRHSERAIELVGLTDRAQSIIATYSKGMRQRLSLARSLLGSPRLLLLDEPFDGIDNESRKRITELLPRIAKSDGTTILITSHNLPDISKISGRVAIMHHGQLLAVDSLDMLTRRVRRKAAIKITLAMPAPAAVLLAIPGAVCGDDNRDILVELDTADGSREAAIKLLLDAGASIVALSEEHVTLEEVYFRLTTDEDKDDCSADVRNSS